MKKPTLTQQLADANERIAELSESRQSFYDELQIARKQAKDNAQYKEQFVRALDELAKLRMFVEGLRVAHDVSPLYKISDMPSDYFADGAAVPHPGVPRPQPHIPADFLCHMLSEIKLKISQIEGYDPNSSSAIHDLLRG